MAILKPDDEADIRTALAELDPCHEAYLENILSCIEMIGTLKVGTIITCRELSPNRRMTLRGLINCLLEWLEKEGCTLGTAYIEMMTELEGLLGQYNSEKARLVDMVISQLAGPVVCSCPRHNPLKQEHKDLVSQMPYLQRCHSALESNIHIVLQGIGRGTAIWDGFRCPPESKNWPELQSIVTGITAWLNGEKSPAYEAGLVYDRLGQRSAGKEQLARSLLSEIN